jgi:hypothetical protein
MKHIPHANRCLLLLAISTACTAAFAAPPQTDPSLSKKPVASGIPRPDLQPQACRRPFMRKGSMAMQAGYSGAIAEFTSPAGSILEIHSIRTALHVPGMFASAVGTWSEATFAWHPLRIEAMQGRYSSSVDGPVYADRASLVKITLNRNGATAVAGTGEYELQGCLIDQLPSRLHLLPIGPIPRLPPKVPAPGEPVEKVRKLEKVQVQNATPAR